VGQVPIGQEGLRGVGLGVAEAVCSSAQGRVLLKRSVWCGRAGAHRVPHVVMRLGTPPQAEAPSATCCPVPHPPTLLMTAKLGVSGQEGVRDGEARGCGSKLR